MKYLFSSHYLTKGHNPHLAAASSGVGQHAATVHVPKNSSEAPMPRCHLWHLWLPARLTWTRVKWTTHCGEMINHQEYWRLRTALFWDVAEGALIATQGAGSLKEQIISHCGSPFPWFFRKHHLHLTALSQKDFHRWLPQKTLPHSLKKQAIIKVSYLYILTKSNSRNAKFLVALVFKSKRHQGACTHSWLLPSMPWWLTADRRNPSPHQHRISALCSIIKKCQRRCNNGEALLLWKSAPLILRLNTIIQKIAHIEDACHQHKSGKL